MQTHTPFSNRNSTHRDAALDIHSDQTFRIVVNEEEVRNRQWKWKLENKSYADVEHHAKPSCIDVGGAILMKKKKENKLTTEFEDVPYQVIERNLATALLFSRLRKSPIQAKCDRNEEALQTRGLTCSGERPKKSGGCKQSRQQ